MKALCYLLKCTYINTIKKLFRRPTAAIFTIFAIFFMCIPIIVTYFAEKNMSPSPYLDIIIGSGSLGYGYLILSVILTSNAGIFYMSDVNLLFTAPIHPKKILLYAAFGSFAGSILMAFYVILNIPLIGGAGVPFIIYFTTGIIFIIFVINITLTYYYGYLLSIKFPKIISNMKKALLLFLVFLGIIFIRCYIISGHDITKGAQIFFTSPYYNMLPVFGWVKWAIVSAIRGDYMKGMTVAVLLQLGLSIAITLLLYNTDIDFYEKVAVDAQAIQNYKDKAKEGRNDISSYYTKKVKKAKAAFGNGAKALWSRQVLELKKSGINMSYIRYLINPIYVAIMSLLGMELIELVIFLMFINLSFGSGESYMIDFKKPFIYLIPQSSLKKAFYNTLMAYCKSLLSGAVAFIVILFMKGPEIVDLIGLYILYASYSIVFLYATLFSQRFLGSHSNMATAGLLRLIVIVIGAIPSTLILILIAIIAGDISNIFLQLLPTIIVNFVIAFILLILSRRIYETAELLD
jgi:hypothetical protein